MTDKELVKQRYPDARISVRGRPATGHVWVVVAPLGGPIRQILGEAATSEDAWADALAAIRDEELSSHDQH